MSLRGKARFQTCPLVGGDPGRVVVGTGLDVAGVGIRLAGAARGGLTVPTILTG